MNILEAEFVHSDSRRRLSQLATADFKQLNHYEAKRGAILGDHYHKDTIEYFFLVKGTVLYNEEKVINKGSMFVVHPRENHKIECLTDVSLITLLTKPFDKENPDLWQREPSLPA